MIAAGGECVALRLFEHNERAYQAAIEMMEQYGKAAIIHPTVPARAILRSNLSRSIRMQSFSGCLPESVSSKRRQELNW